MSTSLNVRNLKRAVLTEACRLDTFTALELRLHLQDAGLDGTLTASRLGGLIASWQEQRILVGRGAGLRRVYRWVDDPDDPGLAAYDDPPPRCAEARRDRHEHYRADGRIVTHWHGGPGDVGHDHPGMGIAWRWESAGRAERQGDQDGRDGDQREGGDAHQDLAGRPAVAAGETPAGRADPDGHPDRQKAGDGQRRAERQDQQRDGGDERGGQRGATHRDRLPPPVRRVLEQDAGPHRQRGGQRDADGRLEKKAARRPVKAEDDAERRQQPVEPAEKSLARQVRPVAHAPTVDEPAPDFIDGRQIRAGRLSTWIARPCVLCGLPIQPGDPIQIRYALKDGRSGQTVGVRHVDCDAQ